ncbi:hypothetical protein [Thalassomonas sp. RHCl1]|uniref:hypothetical protein n=1 Tax=Thalassomonas sp. RHCl1 TaxID=2995320 RepID=UPI00248CC5E4|nr:hypothetical protein [Thalassomonas sp. RHCl1]
MLGKRTAQQAGLSDFTSVKKMRGQHGQAIITRPMFELKPTSFAGSGFVTASPEVLAKRRIVKARRTQKMSPSPFTHVSQGGSQSFPLFQTPQLSLPQQTPPVDYSAFNLRDSVNETGLWQMNQSRKEQLSKQLPTFLGTSSPKSSNIRITAETGDSENWGVSADENVRTQIQRDKKSKMTPMEAEMAYNQRSHQGTLIWKTGSSTLSQYGDKTDTSEALSGHTPGYKSKNVKGTTGAKTKEHGTRDKRREQIVTTTLSDPKRGEGDIAMMGKLATIQLFQSPKEELETVKPELQKLKEPRFSVFSDIGDVSGANSANFDKLSQRQQVVRETDKMYSAKNLMIAGYGNLVPDSHKRLLNQSQGKVDKAMELLHKESSLDKSDIFNTATSSQTTLLNQASLREMSEQNQKTPKLHRPLSPVRKVNAPSFTFGD